MIEAKNIKPDKQGLSTSELDNGIVDMILPVESIGLGIGQKVPPGGAGGN